MSDNRPIKITSRDLFAPDVEDYVEQQAYLTRDVGDIHDRPWVIRVIYANWLYLALFSALGAFVGWAILEPFITDEELANPGEADMIVGLLLFPTIGGFIGLFLGAAEGLMCRNSIRALTSGSVGFGVGFLGACILIIPVGILFAVTSTLAFNISPADPGQLPGGLGFLVLMMGRGIAWAIIAIPAGLGQGIALKEKKVAMNGVLGAVLGGLIGGLLFDPIYAVLATPGGEAAVSRLIGFVCIGAFVGLFVGLIEGWTKTAWLHMKKGPLAGKQFILYKDTTTLGSSPKAEIYLFKDDAIEPRHAQIINRGGRFEIEDLNTPDGTYVNGIPIRRHMLNKGDQIVLGKTVLEFTVKENQ